jgi:class 3 adenylate cyclase/tetratricopeptide (TPR) repeat protein
VRTCPNCGERNPTRAKFCLNCGTRLDVVAAEPEERKLVTVLFSDLVGFTERSDRADPEDVKAMLRVFHARLKEEIEHYGGTVDKFIGDAVLGVFGAPVGHEDDAERAIFAALRIQEAMEELNQERPGLPLAARIGITSGEAVVSFGSGPQIGESVTGDVVNTASRLQNVAPAGGIVVGEPTYRAAAHQFVFEELDQVQVKGKAGRLRIWRPLRSRSRIGLDVRERPRTVFVGRENEAARLRALYRTAVPGGAEGSLQLVTIVGEPGVGKTRLVQEFAVFVEELPDLVRWRVGRSLPFGEGVSFWALGDIVKGEAGILDSDAPEVTEAKLATALSSVVDDEEERDWIRTRLAPLLGIPEAGAAVSREEQFTAWRRFLEAMAEENPLVLIFEDLHWAGDPMLDFIEDFASRGDGRILVLCTARPELYARRETWCAGLRNADTIQLGPLSDSETAILLSALLDRAVLPVETQAMLLERSGGNPLYAEEFVQMLADRGVIDRRSGGRAYGTAADVTIPVPESLQALIGARLDALPASDKALIHDAAVIGKVFWSGALASLTGIGEEEIVDQLDAIARRELVRPSRSSSVEGQAEYTFWHGLVRDVAYGQIPRASRGAKHLAVAEWLESTSGDRVSDVAEELAHHYEEALDLARSAGTGHTPAQLERLTTESARYLLLAGERTLRFDAVKADIYHHRALRLLPPESDLRPRALRHAADTASILGRFEESEQWFAEAIEGFRAVGDVRGAGEAMGMLARAKSKRGDAAGARPLYDEAIDLLEALPPGPELVRVVNRKAGQLLLAGDYGGCRDWADRALTLARELGLDDETVRALQERGASRCELGDETAGFEDLREALRLGLAGGMGEEVALTYGNLAYQQWFREGPATALETWREMESYSERRAYTTHEMWAKTGRLETMFDLGEWDEVLQLAQHVAGWDAEHGDSQVGTYARFFEAWVHLRRGQTDAAARLAGELLPQARRMEYAEFTAPALMISAETERARGNLGAASRHVHEFADITEENPEYRGLFVPVAVRLLVAVGDVDGAERIVPDPAGVRTRRHRLGLDTALAVIAEARGEAGAAARYRDVAAGWGDYGFVLEQGMTMLGEARCLAAEGDPATRDVIERARSVLSRLGARPLVAEVDDLAGTMAAAT